MDNIYNVEKVNKVLKDIGLGENVQLAELVVKKFNPKSKSDVVHFVNGKFNFLCGMDLLSFQQEDFVRNAAYEFNVTQKELADRELVIEELANQLEVGRLRIKTLEERVAQLEMELKQKQE